MWRNISVWHLLIIVLAIVLLFGWKRLPDAARSLGRSLRIFKAEVDQLRSDDQPSAASRDTVPGTARAAREDLGEDPEDVEPRPVADPLDPADDRAGTRDAGSAAYRDELPRRDA